ncbi:MAG: hypothetical protein JNM70_21750 [Anaerolineae bacterium]|nr:hypothetical protein [Anaerolineae bacterium]
MNILRRLIVLLMGVALIGATAALLLVPKNVGEWAGSISEVSLVIRLLLAVVIGAVLLLLTLALIRPDPRAKLPGLVMRTSGALADVSVESARERILKAVGDVKDVVSVEAQVKPVQGRADVELHVTVFGHDVRLPDKQKEINRAISQVVDKQLGLRMAGQPRVHIRIHGEETARQPTVAAPPVTMPSSDIPDNLKTVPLPPAARDTAEPDLKPLTQSRVVEPSPDLDEKQEKNTVVDGGGVEPQPEPRLFLAAEDDDEPDQPVPESEDKAKPEADQSRPSEAI